MTWIFWVAVAVVACGASLVTAALVAHDISRTFRDFLEHTPYGD